MAQKKASLLPEGFAPLDFERLAGYFARKQGNAICGIYVGNFTPKKSVPRSRIVAVLIRPTTYTMMNLPKK